MIGWFRFPMSPEKTIQRRSLAGSWPFSVKYIPMDDEPSMCPASVKRTPMVSESSVICPYSTGTKRFRTLCASSTEYSGWTGFLPALRNLRFFHLASSSWILALSSSIMEQRSIVALVLYMRPLKPFFSRRGSLPLWSMWAWLSSTTSMPEALNGRHFPRRFSSLP